MNNLMKKLGIGTTTSSDEFMSLGEHKNDLEVNIENIEQHLTDWTIPKVEPSTIYSIGTFNFMTNYSIKTVEQTVALNSTEQKLCLLTEETINQHRKKGFKYLHIGLVQIGVKPLFRLGCDTPVLLCLRDERHRDFENSLLAILESNLTNGPIYSQCYPNYSISLLDPNILKTLQLTVKVKNLELNNSLGICVIYRIYYKVMTTTLNPRSRITNPIKETIQFEYNKAHGTAIIPRRLKWDEVLNSGEWDLEEAIPPEEPKILKSISEIFKNSNTGLVRIKFDKSPSRKISEIPLDTSSQCSTSTLPPLNIRGINLDKNISEPIYNDNEKNNSPTRSEMDFTNISGKFY